MALNEFGAGFKIYAKDFASGVFGKVGKNFSAMSQKAENDANKMSAGLARIGKGMAMMGAGFTIVKPMQLAVRESAKLNKSLAEVSTLTDEATFPMAQMKDLVKDTAAQYGQESTIQAKALYQTISAGYGEAEEAAKMLTTANKLAVGGVTEVDTAVDGLTNIMNTYSAANLDAGDVSDAMFVSMKEGKTTIGEISSQIGRVAPAAEAMGIGFTEVLGTIAAVTSKGISTAQTVSGMGAALANINKPSKDAADEAKRLGIEFTASGLRAKGLKGFLDQITGSAKFNKDSIAKLFGSIEAFKTMTALTTNESEKFNNVMEKMETRVGATDNAVEKMENTFEHQAKRFKIINKNILASIGDAVEGVLAPVLKFFNKVSSAIGKFIDTLPPGVKKTIVVITGGFGAFIGLAGGILVLSGAMKILGVSMTGAIFGFGKMLLVMIPVTLALGFLGISVFSLAKAFRKNTGSIAVDWSNMAKKVTLAWKGMMKIISGESFGDEFKEQLSGPGAEGVSEFLSRFEAFSQRIKALWSGIVIGFERGVDNLAQSSAMANLRTAVQGITEMFSGTGAEDDIDILKRWEAQGETTGEKLASFGEVALNAAGNVLYLTDQFMKFMADVDAEQVASAVSAITTGMKDMGTAISIVGEGLRVVWKLIASVVNAFQFLGAVMGETFAQIASGDFAPDFEASKKYGERFTTIWENSDDRINSAKNVRGSYGSGTQTPDGVRAAEQMKNIEVQQLKERQAALSGLMEGGSIEKGGKQVKFEQLTMGEKADVVRAIQQLGAQIETLANRPINLEMDGEKVAEQLNETDEANGVRDYSGSFGY